MKTVIQRVRDASVSVNGVIKGSIGYGLLVYLGIARDDTRQDAEWLAEKAVNLRIFDDSKKKMNLSLMEVIGRRVVNYNARQVNNNVNQYNEQVNYASVGILTVSQFTLLGDARKGRRPSWGMAAPPEQARDLYHYFIEKIREKVPCMCGEFQAAMQLSCTNDGPVTIVLDSREVMK